MATYIGVRLDGDSKWWKLCLISGMNKIVRGYVKYRSYPIDETQYHNCKIVSYFPLPICCMTKFMW